ncbi:MAG: DUF2938 family protein [Chromatiales bacterium]|nr:DUF2938 family protein [Gammaproteobacteria bacterium]MBW6475817.1 DUF2938 family protein [Chromatiales bacterium]
MNKMLAGMIAGLAATVVLSVLMVVKGMMGLMPDVDVIQMLAKQMSSGTAMGWVAHFMIGVVGYGIVYARLFSKLPFGGHALRGLVLGVAGWLAMMLMLMPMMGAGLFGLQMPSGMMAPVATLMLHAIFGVVLGLVFAKLAR